MTGNRGKWWLGVIFGCVFVLLAISGYALTAVPGQWLLLLHVALGAFFTALLVLGGFFWAEVHTDPTRFPRSARFGFWGVMCAGLLLIVSAVLPMWPVLGTEGQHIAVTLHGIAAAFSMLAGLIWCWGIAVMAR